MVNLYSEKKFKKWSKYPLFIILFCSSLLGYSQENHKFDLVEKFIYPTTLKISIIIKNHEKIEHLEEYLIYTKSIGDSYSVFKMYAYTLNYNLEKANIDTAFTLNGHQTMILNDFCEYIFKNQIPIKYQNELVESEPSGIFVTYTMEIGGERYTFSDKRMLSLATLMLFNKNNW